ncbi:MAG: quinone-dependent dihydroorotate dehydrogenase, partial [Verrucomicrobiia bacterium]
LTEYKFPIIGVGGISSTESAIRKLDAGASLLQIYSSLVYQGPFFPSRLATSLEHRTKNWT